MKNIDNKIKHLELFENELVNHTLTSYTNLIKELPKRKYIGLDVLLESINKSLDEPDRETFFDEYIDSVVKNVSLIEENMIPTIVSELDTNVLMISKNDKVKVIIINEKLDNYKIPTEILKEYKKVLKK